MTEATAIEKSDVTVVAEAATMNGSRKTSSDSSGSRGSSIRNSTVTSV